MLDIWGKATQPLGSVIVDAYGTHLDKQAASQAANTGTGPGQYPDGAGNFHLTEAQAKASDAAAAAKGGYW